jgi:Fe-S cluster biogenesis protein NfuA
MSDAPQIRITAEPQVIPTNCLFRIERPVYVGTLYVSDPTWAAEWAPLVGHLFAEVECLKGVRLADAEVLITMKEVPEDWRLVARTAGAAIRSFLQDGGEPVKDGALDALKDHDLLRHKAQMVIDADLNPNLASHGGWVEIQSSEGTDLFITMGGGCQGCGSAAMTMRQGVEVAIRNAVPEVGAIHDATDHASGANPYM